MNEKELNAIRKAKLDYEKAKKNKDTVGMARARITADKARGYRTVTKVEDGKYVQKKFEASPEINGALQKATVKLNTPKPIPRVVAPWTSVQTTYNNSVKPIPRPIPRANLLADAFDSKENYVDKFKKGNVGGGVANFIGSGLLGAQSVSLNALNAVDSLASGKGLPKFQNNMSKDMYDREIVGRDGETETIKDKISNQNKVLGGIYGLANEISSDPLELTPLGFLNDIKLAKGGKQITEAYAKALQDGKMVGKIPQAPSNAPKPLPRAQTTKSLVGTLQKAPRPIPRATKPQGIPQAPTSPVQPIKPNLGTNIPKEQVFAKNSDIPKFKDLGADVNSNL